MQRLEFVPERDFELFAAVPASAAVFVLRGTDEGSEPYVSKTSNLRRRLQRLLGATEGQSRKLNLRDRVRWIEWTATGSDFEASFLLYKTLRREFPKTYDKRLRLRFAPLVKLILDNPYPRATVTSRISGLKSKSRYFGPFPTRVAAEKFANDSLDLFKMRRCTFDLNPDPAFPGCIYSEMKMCLAPCFKGCTDEEYAAEVGRVQQYLESGGQSLVREIERQRDEASANLDFENASALHVRLEKVKAAASLAPEIVRRLDELNGVMVQPSAAQRIGGAVQDCRGVHLRSSHAQCGQAGGGIASGIETAVDGGAHHRGAGSGRASQAARGAGVDGAPRAPKALVLPQREGWGVVSRRQQRRAADAAGGPRRVARLPGRKAGGRLERDRRGLLAVSGRRGWP